MYYSFYPSMTSPTEKNHTADLGKALLRTISRGHETLDDTSLIENLALQLLESRASVTETDAQGCNALHYSALFDYERIAGALIDASQDVNAVNEEGDTALFMTNNTSTILKLIRCCADINLKNRAGFTALTNTMETSQNPVDLNNVKLLLAHQADVNTSENGTPLQYAVLLNCCDLVQCLLEWNADANMKISTGQTPLQYSLGLRNVKIMDVLMDS